MKIARCAKTLAPEELFYGREKAPLVVSPGILEDAGDQTAPLATVGANSSARSSASILQAVAQLSGTMIMLTEAGELGLARAIHEAIGKMLIRSDDHEAEGGAASAGLAFRADIR